MFYLISVGLAFISLIVALLHLGQTFNAYVDLVAFAVVFGGTTAVSFAVLPFSLGKDFTRALSQLWKPEKWDSQIIAQEGLRFVQSARNGAREFQPQIEGIAGDVLRDGMELITLGFGRDKVEKILSERVYQAFERNQRVAQSLRSLAKYPPAFGLTGTVFGLVTLMRSVANGAGAKETGIQMAIALVATMYGLLISNIVINPAGESVQKFANEDRKRGETSLEAVLLAVDGASLLEAQEVLNSHLIPEKRVSVLSTLEAA